MNVGKSPYRVLIVSGESKTSDSLASLLPAKEFSPIWKAGNAGEARRMLTAREADLVVINTPLPDEFGTELALDLSENPMGILLLVKNESFEQVCDQVEDSGVLTVGKPNTRQAIYSALRLLGAMCRKLEKWEKKNRTLQEKMADIRAVNRAKWLLIEKRGMSEEDAHYYIEKKAMDERLSRREVAEGIIQAYQ